MEFLRQSFWHNSVIRESERYLLSKTSYLDSQMELVAVIRVEVNSLKIKDAWLDRLGRPGAMGESREYIESLKGIVAYLGSGLELRHALQGIEKEIERSLFNNSIKGIIQAETFFYQERGFSDAAAYDDAWKEFYSGSCCYYSNLGQITTSWTDYCGQTLRRINLFDRCLSQQLYRVDEEVYIINGSLIDTFHQINTCLKLDKRMGVTAAFGQLLRVPDPVCQAAITKLANIKGYRLPDLSKKEIATLLGAGEGCVHLIDLVYESKKTLELYLKQ